MRHHFWAQHASIQYRSSGIQRPRHQHPRSSLRHSHGLHPSMMPQRKAAAGCPRSVMHPICPQYRCANISGRNVRRYSIAHAQISASSNCTHAALCDTAFASIRARCRNAKLLLSAPEASCIPSAPETDAPPFLRRPPIDTALLTRQFSDRSLSTHAALCDTAFASIQA